VKRDYFLRDEKREKERERERERERRGLLFFKIIIIFKSSIFNLKSI